MHSFSYMNNDCRNADDSWMVFTEWIQIKRKRSCTHFWIHGNHCNYLPRWTFKICSQVFIRNTNTDPGTFPYQCMNDTFWMNSYLFSFYNYRNNPHDYRNIEYQYFYFFSDYILFVWTKIWRKHVTHNTFYESCRYAGSDSYIKSL